MYTYKCMRVYLCLHLYVYMCMCICICMCMCVYFFMYVYKFCTAPWYICVLVWLSIDLFAYLFYTTIFRFIFTHIGTRALQRRRRLHWILTLRFSPCTSHLLARSVPCNTHFGFNFSARNIQWCSRLGVTSPTTKRNAQVNSAKCCLSSLGHPLCKAVLQVWVWVGR